MSFHDGLLYANTGFPANPARIFGLDPNTGAVASGPIEISTGTTASADGFAVLPNGHFLINADEGSCTYNEFDATTGARLAGTTLTVPGPSMDLPTLCSGVDTDGTSLYFAVDGDGFVKTDLNGAFISKTFVTSIDISDISLVHSAPAAGAASGSGPTVSSSVSPAPNPVAWNNTPVSITLTSNLSSCGPITEVAALTFTDDALISLTTVAGGAAVVPVGFEGKTTLRFWATDTAGNIGPESSQLVQIDTTPPTIRFDGNAGAYTSAQTITITCVASDAAALSSGVASDTCASATLDHVPAAALGAGVASISYVESGAQTAAQTTAGATAVATIAAEGTTSVSFHATDVAGNIETPDHVVVVTIDSTPPATSVAPLSPPANLAGWNNSAVSVTLTAVDPPGTNGAAGSGVASISYVESGAQAVTQTTAGGSAVLTVAAQGTTSVSFQATDMAGNVERQPAPVVVRVDATKPVIALSGNAGTYTVDQTITIGCTAADALSGIASDTCASATLNNVPAYTLGLGIRTLQATATDRAGNTTSAATTCSVVVTAKSLCTLQAQFVQGSPTYAALTAMQKSTINSTLASLCQTLGNISPGLTATQRAALLAFYRQSLDALVKGGLLTSTQETILLKLANAL